MARQIADIQLALAGFGGLSANGQPEADASSIGGSLFEGTKQSFE